ncbi:MAG: hypothetical protein ACMG6S_13640 [Byssovorax sp.]
MTVLVALAALFLQSPSPAPSPSPRVAPSPVGKPSPTVHPVFEPIAPPTAEAVVTVVQKTKEFAADSGRTALTADPTRRLPVPGVGDLGYFVEIHWTDKQGAAHTGLAVVAHDTVQGVPWMVKGEGWGLVKVLEDKTVEGVAGDLAKARMAANEASAVGDIRTIYSAEMLFMAVADGSYGDLRCLNIPADCIADIPGEKLLERSLTTATEKSGYRRKFHGGTRVTSAKAKGNPSPFVKTFAYTAVPITRGETGTRSFCGDSSGKVCVVDDGTEPKVVDGVCTPCAELK